MPYKLSECYQMPSKYIIEKVVYFFKLIFYSKTFQLDYEAVLDIFWQVQTFYIAVQILNIMHDLKVSMKSAHHVDIYWTKVK